MRISEPTADAIRYVALNMRDRDFDEFSAVSYAGSREELAADITARYDGRGDVMVADVDGEPICVGATIMARPNVVTLLFFATDRFPEIALPITRFIKRQLFPRLAKAGVHRVEAISMVGYEHAHRWLEALGLTPETIALRAYGKNRQDFVQYSVVWND